MLPPRSAFDCGATGYKRRGCPKPTSSAQASKQSQDKPTNKGKAKVRGHPAAKPINRGTKRSSTQPTDQSATNKRICSTSSSSSQPEAAKASTRTNARPTNPGSTTGRPKSKPTNALSSSQPNISATKTSPTPRKKALTQPTKKASIRSSASSTSQSLGKRNHFFVSTPHISL
ncbi:hypothetical protein PIB30_023577 [Stylosanthes scabra]|uniref:Uncharacterized protein n=1 Tax=Stylosanthes scabra TaxID=79078 RepID=A0ABU6X7S5_9FABA|nr:hypothetical protein [Stylosanthes scabra]